MSKIRQAVLRVPVLLAGLLLLSRVVAAAADPVPASKVARLQLDPSRTTIAYSLSGWPHNTHGTFKLKHGLIAVEPATGKMAGAIVVDAASGTSGETIRDARMRLSILSTSQFPEISFTPEQVESHGYPPGEFPIRVSGLMLLHGVEHRFSVDATVRRDGNQVTIHCSFSIPYVAWGLEDPSILMFKVAKEVKLDVNTVAELTWVALPLANASAVNSP